MGFWHTGYMDKHGPLDLEGRLADPPSRTYTCNTCGKEFPSAEALDYHGFEHHPFLRPRLYVSDVEIGANPLPITERLNATDIRVVAASRAWLNDDPISVTDLGARLGRVSSDLCTVVLSSEDDVKAEFKLDFRVASENDLDGIERSFGRMARSGRLDRRAVDEFCASTARFSSAGRYRDGVCEYLYGVLAKEGEMFGASLGLGDCVPRFNRCVARLNAYPKRLLAQAMCGLVAFQFNHFETAASSPRGLPVREAAATFRRWLRGLGVYTAEEPESAGLEGVEASVVDLTTDRIISWVRRGSGRLGDEVAEIESLRAKHGDDHDGVKLRVVLGEAYAASGRLLDAVRTARELRNLALTERWADELMRRCQTR